MGCPGRRPGVLPSLTPALEPPTLTSREMMRALRALLPSTKENSLTCASPAATTHLMCWLVVGRSRDRTSAARANCGGSDGSRPKSPGAGTDLTHP